MKRILAPFIGIAAFFILIFFLSYVFPPLMEFLAWWFLTKESISAPLSTGQTVLIDIITHIITYISVGAIFGFLGWFDKKAMHYAYVLISEAVSLGLLILLRFIIDYYWVIFIILGVLVVVAVVLFIILKVRDKDKKDDGEPDEEEEE